ncbi:hypothetical protein IWX90DRAFT_22330 [Phyllosticta citrichinensis]|uniref:Uncharacterized protein n=1 Tax=Phyllosticta citrichinensis TaxID=1130410 RepID=A0ABR1Y7J7_9PEZI
MLPVAVKCHWLNALENCRSVSSSPPERFLLIGNTSAGCSQSAPLLAVGGATTCQSGGMGAKPNHSTSIHHINHPPTLIFRTCVPVVSLPPHPLSLLNSPVGQPATLVSSQTGSTLPEPPSPHGRVPAKSHHGSPIKFSKCDSCKQALNLGVSELKMTIALLMSSCLNQPLAQVVRRHKLQWDARRLFDLRPGETSPHPPCATPVAPQHSH